MSANLIVWQKSLRIYEYTSNEEDVFSYFPVRALPYFFKTTKNEFNFSHVKDKVFKQQITIIEKKNWSVYFIYFFVLTEDDFLTSVKTVGRNSQNYMVCEGRSNLN